MKAIYVASLASILMATSSLACPNCNIFNYLGHSVECSKDIQLVEVMHANQDTSVTVKILEVIRGNAKADGIINLDFPGDAKMGARFIRCTPRGMPPTFPILAESLLPEVRLLSSGRPEIRDATHAVQCVQGVSKVTTELALNYIESHYGACREELITVFNTLYHAQETWADKPFLDHQFQGLIRGLLVQADPQSVEFLKGLIHRISNEKETRLDPTQRPYRGEPQGNLLSILLDTNIEPKTRGAFKNLMQEEIQKCAPANTRWFSYAFAQDIIPELTTLWKTLPEEHQKSAAWGIYDRSLYFQSWGDNLKSKACQEAALALGQNLELNAAIEKDKTKLR